MNEPQHETKREVIYVPPSPEVIEKFARDVCRTLAEKHGEDCNSTGFIRGFTDFVKVIVQINTNRRNRQIKQQMKEA